MHPRAAPAPAQASAASGTSGTSNASSSVYGDDLPPEVVALLEARRVADKLQTKWVAAVAVAVLCHSYLAKGRAAA